MGFKMTKVIYKYGPVTPSYDCIVQGRIVSVGMQNNQIYVWAEQHGNVPPRRIKFVPTGIPYDGIYVGTVFEENGALVWHVIMDGIL
jgi:hypothetical protein